VKDYCQFSFTFGLQSPQPSLIDQDFRFGILIGSIIHQFASFWYIPVRFPIQLLCRGV
jgi:hypothetical protein